MLSLSLKVPMLSLSSGFFFFFSFFSFRLSTTPEQSLPEVQGATLMHATPGQPRSC